jgi:hypothetical protein
MEEITEARSKAIAKTIKPISVEELNKIGEGLFPYHDHPWRERFYTFISENAGATIHHATTNDQIHIIYCLAQNKGMWFLPGSGMGPLQPRGLDAMKKIVEAEH